MRLPARLALVARWMLVETSPGKYCWPVLPEAFVPRR